MYNPFSLEGKTILVTGASSGIGRAIAIECSRLGAKICLSARNKKRLQETYSLLAGDGHQILAADLNNPKEVLRLADEVPLLSGCVNNAGIQKTLLTQFITIEALQELMQINTFAPILLTQALIKRKKMMKGGSFVFLSSISGTSRVWAGNTIYSTSKAAICGFVKNAALDLAPKKIRVNAVCPGMIDTGIMNEGVITSEQIAEDAKRYPLKRYGYPEEVAYAVIYLLSDAASFVTGSNLVIDGGITLV